MPSEPRDRRLPGYAERQSKLRFRDWRFRVRDILAAVRAIEAYTEGMTFEEFAADSRTVDAVVRNLMTIGESTRWIPEPIKDAHREVPWRTLRGMRNVVVHEYFGVDSEILWETVRTDLPPLAPTLEAILQG
ncbi:MAG: DUF86 domain-containing protein [Actinomycetes bacterium]